jgi:SAM-dependent methyltransferase
MKFRNGARPLNIKKLLSRLEKTPFHPQWFALHGETAGLREICSGLEGLVIDIGCAEGRPKDYLAPTADYLGIDYYTTAVDWYGTKPDLYSDAQSLPLVANSVDHALLLDVLEHIPNPERCLAEVYRALKPGGSLTIQVPFLYPVHDAPLDFHRWTRFGLLTAAEKQGYSVEKERVLGHPLESAALNANIALSQTVLNWLRNKNILGLTAILLPLAVLLINILAWGGARLSKPDPLMPYGYRMVWTKD